MGIFFMFMIKKEEHFAGSHELQRDLVTPDSETIIKDTCMVAILLLP